MSIKQKITNEIYEGVKGKTNKEIADVLTTALSTPITLTSANGLAKQIAIIEVIDHIEPLTDKYSFLDKGNLGYGEGEQFITVGIKASVDSSIDINSWLPEGPLDTLAKQTFTSIGSIERKVTNDYPAQEMKEYVRDASTFGKLINKEMSAGPETKAREQREAARFVFGITSNAKYLPGDYSDQLVDVKNQIAQNAITVTTTTSKKSIVNYMNDFMDEYYNNISDQYNMGNKPGNTTGKIFIKGVQQETNLLDNSAKQENTVLIMSTKFKNRLQEELGDTYNPKYWTDFTKQFGMVIEDTFADVDNMFILDKRSIGYKSVFNEYTNTYYPDKSAFHTLGKWKDHWFMIPGLNAIKFIFSSTKKKAEVKEVKVIEPKAEVKEVKVIEPKAEVKHVVKRTEIDTKPEDKVDVK